jgi:hypothetical protein
VTRQEALILLGAEESNYEDVVITSIFEHKQFLLKSVITPQVFKTRARKLSVISEAFKFLNNETTEVPHTQLSFTDLILEDLSIKSLLTFYRQYENIMSNLKLKFMQDNDPAVVSNSCIDLSELEHQKLITVSNATNSLLINSLTEIKISEFVNSGEIRKELNNSNDWQISQENIISFPTFIKDVSRSRKYANFTNQKNITNA